jgi:hypothetical protein
MIPLNLKPSGLRAPDDSSFRYYEPARPTDGADRLHIGGGTYRLDYVSIPRDGSEPLVAIERQTAAGRDFKSERGRQVVPLSDLGTVNIAPSAHEDAAPYVQQIRSALLHALLDDVEAEQPASWGGPSATIPVDESEPLTDALDDEEAPEGTATSWQPCVQGCGRRTMHESGLCSKCRQLDATMREQMATEPEYDPYDGVHGYDPASHAAITDRRVAAIIPVLQEVVERGAALTLDAEHAAALVTYLGWHKGADAPVVADPPTDRVVRLSTRHPEPDQCKGAEYGTWCAVGSTLAEFLDEAPGVALTAADIRIVAAWHNVSPFAVLDLLDKRGIEHAPNPALVPEGSEVEQS